MSDKRLPRDKYFSQQRKKLWAKRCFVATEFLRKLKYLGAIVDFTEEDIKKQVIAFVFEIIDYCADTGRVSSRRYA